MINPVQSEYIPIHTTVFRTSLYALLSRLYTSGVQKNLWSIFLIKIWISINNLVLYTTALIPDPFFVSNTVSHQTFSFCSLFLSCPSTVQSGKDIYISCHNMSRPVYQPIFHSFYSDQTFHCSNYKSTKFSPFPYSKRFNPIILTKHLTVYTSTK